MTEPEIAPPLQRLLETIDGVLRSNQSRIGPIEDAIDDQVLNDVRALTAAARSIAVDTIPTDGTPLISPKISTAIRLLMTKHDDLVSRMGPVFPPEYLAPIIETYRHSTGTAAVELTATATLTATADVTPSSADREAAFVLTPEQQKNALLFLSSIGTALAMEAPGNSKYGSLLLVVAAMLAAIALSKTPEA